MSKHIEKYPGLYARCKAGKLSYQVMYMRCRSGMTVDAALAKPIGRCGRAPGVKQGPRPATPVPRTKHGPRSEGVSLYQMLSAKWDRATWNAAAHREKKVRVTRKRYVRHIEDTSPAHIQRIRTAFCAEFIKTGELNTSLQQQLKDYADERRAANKHLARISDEHAASRHYPAAANAGDDRRRDADQIDAGAAKRISEFLRT